MLNVELLQNFENQVAKKQNRQPAKITTFAFPKGLENIISMYERNKHQIIINNLEMLKLNDIELIATVLHEGRHAYQWEQINNPEKSIENKALINTWKDEFLKYDQKSANDKDESYLNLEIEIDAVAYASLNIYNVTKLKLHLAPEMKDQVLKRQEEIKLRKDNF